MQNQADSNEVLRSPLATEIREPGRAYLQVGNNETFELFQSAYSGAPAVINTDQKKKFQLYSSSIWGKKSLLFEQKPERSGDDSQSQLDAIVNPIARYAEKKQIEKLPSICLPPLRKNIPYTDEVREKKDKIEVRVPLGIYDDPNRQLQEQVSRWIC